MLTALDNFVDKGNNIFNNNPQHIEMYLNLSGKYFNNDDLSEKKLQLAVKLVSLLFHFCKFVFHC